MMEDVLPETMPGLNLKGALARLGIPALVFKAILLKFLETNSIKVTAIEQELAAGRLDALSRFAHGLKGSSGSIGAESLYDAAMAVDKSIRAGGGQEEVAPLVTVLLAELEIVLDSLRALE
jgi:HPt (histidine-containing phosphotransfer) domain-containing protein